MHSNKPKISEVKMNGIRRRMRILMVFLACFMGWAAITLWDQMDKVDAKKSELQKLEAEWAETQMLNEQYQHEIQRLNDPEYIEQRIYKDLQMTKEGDTLIIRTN